LNLSPVLVGEEVSPGDEKSCLNDCPRDPGALGFKEIALQSGLRDGGLVHHTSRPFVQ
jgi:hypothetical protein